MGLLNRIFGCSHPHTATVTYTDGLWMACVGCGDRLYRLTAETPALPQSGRSEEPS